MKSIVALLFGILLCSSARGDGINVPGPNGQPNFRVTLNSGQSLTTATITKVLFDTVDVDIGSYWNTSTKIYQPLVPGTYQFCFSTTVLGTFTAVTQNLINWISKNGTVGGTGVSQIGLSASIPALVASQENQVGCTLVAMNGSTDTVEVNIDATGTSLSIPVSTGRGTQFSGYRIGP